MQTPEDRFSQVKAHVGKQTLAITQACLSCLLPYMSQKLVLLLANIKGAGKPVHLQSDQHLCDMQNVTFPASLCSWAGFFEHSLKVMFSLNEGLWAINIQWDIFKRDFIKPSFNFTKIIFPSVAFLYSLSIFQISQYQLQPATRLFYDHKIHEIFLDSWNISDSAVSSLLDRKDRVKLVKFGQSSKFGQRPCFFYFWMIGIKIK